LKICYLYALSHKYRHIDLITNSYIICDRTCNLCFDIRIILFSNLKWLPDTCVLDLDLLTRGSSLHTIED